MAQQVGWLFESKNHFGVSKGCFHSVILHVVQQSVSFFDNLSAVVVARVCGDEWDGLFSVSRVRARTLKSCIADACLDDRWWILAGNQIVVQFIHPIFFRGIVRHKFINSLRKSVYNVFLGVLWVVAVIGKKIMAVCWFVENICSNFSREMENK